VNGSDPVPPCAGRRGRREPSLHGRVRPSKVRSPSQSVAEGILVLKVLGWIILVIFLIGLLVVIGIFDLIF